MRFEIISSLTNVETIASGSGIRDLARLRRKYGRGVGEKWRALLKWSCLTVRFILRSFTG